ncbi:MAG: class II fructose-bisphosphate aldolase family protein [Mycolicibacterium sp.]|nr:class II fructose-bisphosphate aldolase family protein [Mycolicibacterium sp.]
MTSAAAQQGAVLAFNVIGIEHAQGIAAGAEHAGVPVLMQVSENTVRFHGSLSPLVSACAHIARQSSIDIAVHLDHLQNPDLITEAISTADALGVTSIMVDAAHLPYRDNVARTRLYVRQAHDVGLWAEAELGEIGGKDGAHTPGARTDPAEAAAFSADTEIDGLAVAVGSSHAMTTRDASLDIALIGEIAARVDVPLVLHGSSGVPDDQLGRAVDAGIRKINVGTALNIAYTAAVRRVLAAETTTVDPRPHLAAGRDAIAAAVSDLCSSIQPTAAALRRDPR